MRKRTRFLFFTHHEAAAAIAWLISQGHVVHNVSPGLSRVTLDVTMDQPQLDRFDQHLQSQKIGCHQGDAE